MFLAVNTLRHLSREHGRYGAKEAKPEAERLITAEDLNRLGEALLARIRQSAADASLIEAPNLHHILYHWQEADGGEATRNWTKACTETREHLTLMLRALREESTAQSIENVLMDRRYGFDTTALRDYVDVATFAERASQHLETGKMSQDEARTPDTR